MDVSGYTADDLDIFRRVLDRAVAEDDNGMPLELMARRLFVVARAGDRDPDRLLAAVLGRGDLAAKLAKLTPPPLPPTAPTAMRKSLYSAPNP